MAPPSRLCSSESESIGREFVDNWSHYISLLETNTERDVLNLLNLLENVRVKWQKSEAEAKHYKDKLVTYEKNMKAMLDENNSLNDKLLNCQSQLSHVSECKRDVEKELADYKDQWEKLRSIIKENDQTFVSDGLLAIINNVQRSNSVRRNITQEVTTKTLFEEEENDEVSTMESTQSDIDYDKTGESSDSSFENPRRASRKRRSRSQVPKSSRTTVRFGQSSIKEEPEVSHFY
uniref:Uncharacterized protein n=1 Tax=Panagrolaimus davidi TaxID=227884 RepID=A0A914PW48_9BILA